MFRDIIKEFVEMIRSVKCLLHTHANESTRKLSVMVHACNLGTGEAEQERCLRLPDQLGSLRDPFSKSKWSALEKDTQDQPLAFTCAYMRAHSNKFKKISLSV